MTVRTIDFTIVEARGYIPEEQADIRAFIKEFGEYYDSLDILLDDWSDQ